MTAYVEQSRAIHGAAALDHCVHALVAYILRRPVWRSPCLAMDYSVCVDGRDSKLSEALDKREAAVCN